MGDIRTKTHGAISHTAPELLLDGLLSKAADVRGWGREGFVCVGGQGCCCCCLMEWARVYCVCMHDGGGRSLSQRPLVYVRGGRGCALAGGANRMLTEATRQDVSIPDDRRCCLTAHSSRAITALTLPTLPPACPLTGLLVRHDPVGAVHGQTAVRRHDTEPGGGRVRGGIVYPSCGVFGGMLPSQVGASSTP